MPGPEPRSQMPAMTIDDVAAALRHLRIESGSPSYAEIAARISQSRQASGATPERSRIARTTVYDLFRDGRRRVDIALVREVLVALELDDTVVEQWCVRARHAAPGDAASATSADESTLAPLKQDEVRPRPADSAVASTSPRWLPQVGRSRAFFALFLAGCVLMNLPGHAVVAYLGLPLHLDMIGTAVAAMLAGPWWGALVGVVTNGVGAGLSGTSSLAFAAVNVAGALVWGYGVRQFGMGRTIPRFFALNVMCAVVCSCVATPILLILYGGEVGHASDGLTDNILAIAHVKGVSVFTSNLMISLADKFVSGFIALAVIESVASPPAKLAIQLGPRAPNAP